MLRQTDIITASSIGRALILMNSNPNPITDITEFYRKSFDTYEL